MPAAAGMAMVMTVRGMDSTSEAGHGWGGEGCAKLRKCGVAVLAVPLLLEERGGPGEFMMERRIVVSSRAAPQSEGAWSNVSPVEPVHHICQLLPADLQSRFLQEGRVPSE